MRYSSPTVFILLLAIALKTDALLIDSKIYHSGYISKPPTFPGLFTKQHGIHSKSNRRDTKLMYEPNNDPPNNFRPLLGGDGVWSALATTERWISETLQQSSRTNPYVRKEVSYVCETTEDPIMVVASVFRRVREARELGELHSETEENILVKRGPDYEPGTLRQTQVVVIPWCKAFDSFPDFEATYQAINAARRSARDYVTDISLEKVNNDSMERWGVSISLASLHPKYGTKTMAENLTEMKIEEQEGEVDVNLEEYKKRRNLARQSPYPSLVLEVKAMPSPDFGSSPPNPTQKSRAMGGPETNGQSNSNETGGLSKEDLKKLEALFGLSPSTGKGGEDSFYDSIGQVIDEVSVEDPTTTAQRWLTQNDPSYKETASFSVTDAKHVDSAYEVVFTSIAMQKKSPSSQSSSKDNSISSAKADSEPEGSRRAYIIMPHFLSSSATSFWKFSMEVSKILDTAVGPNEHFSVFTFHPEHVDGEKRCPLPALVFEWGRE